MAAFAALSLLQRTGLSEEVSLPRNRTVGRVYPRRPTPLRASSSNRRRSQFNDIYLLLSPHSVDLVVDIAGCHSGPPQHSTLRINFFGNTRMLLRTCQGFPWGSSKNFDIQSQELLLHGGVEQRSRHAEVKEETDVLKIMSRSFTMKSLSEKLLEFKSLPPFPLFPPPPSPAVNLSRR